MSDNAKVVAALLAGLAAGAALGILFAPEKGSETRGKLNDSLKDLGDAIKDRTNEQLNNISEVADKFVETVKSKISKAEADLDDAIEEHA
jgi:gas vesicle protein